MLIEFPVFPNGLTVVTDETTHERFHNVHQYSVDMKKLTPRKPSTNQKPKSKKENVKLIPRKNRVQKSEK